jgi:diguanylate cyclase (GGDEF)-like protein
MKKLRNEEEEPLLSYLEAESPYAARSLSIHDKKLSQHFQEYQIQQSLLLKELDSVDGNKQQDQQQNAACPENYDPLTGLPNCQYAKNLLEGALQLAKKNDDVLIILYLIIDDFNQVNRLYGYGIGSQVLVTIAQRLRKTVRNGRLLSRIGGDEFFISLTLDKDELSLADEIRQRIIKLVTQPMPIDNFIVSIEITLGIVAYPIHGDKIDVLLNIANNKIDKIRSINKKPH